MFNFLIQSLFKGLFYGIFLSIFFKEEVFSFLSLKLKDIIFYFLSIGNRFILRTIIIILITILINIFCCLSILKKHLFLLLINIFLLSVIFFQIIKFKTLEKNILNLINSKESFLGIFNQNKLIFSKGNLQINNSSFKDIKSFKNSLILNEVKFFLEESENYQEIFLTRNFLISPFRLTGWIVKNKEFIVIYLGKFSDTNTKIFNSFSKLMNSLKEGVILTNNLGKIEFYNKVAEDFLGPTIKEQNIKHIDFEKSKLVVEKEKYNSFFLYKLDKEPNPLEEVINFLPFAVFVCDFSFNLLNYNSTFQKHFDINNNILEIVIKEQEELFRKYLNECIEHNSFLPPTSFILRKNKISSTIYVRKMPNERLNICFFADSILNEITYKVLHEQRIYSLGEIIGSISHDFNNIVTTILTIIDLYIEKNQLNELGEDYSQLMGVKSCAQRGAELIKQILKMARKNQINEEKQINAVKVLTDFTNTIGRILSEKIDFIFEKANLEINILMNEVILEQIVTNLVINARDAMTNGGKIILRIESYLLEKSLEINNFFAIEGKYAKITVSDNGCGIPEENLHKIFNLFFTTKKNKGNGFGLATVKSIVEKYGGFIKINSQVNKGTTFEIYLPSIELLKRKEAITRQERDNKNTVIAIVEDEENIATFLKKSLENKDFKVISALSGEEILLDPLLKEAKLLITDLTLPNINGEELSKEVLKINSNIKIIFMSGYVDLDNENKNCEKKNFIEKPFSIEELINLIDKTI